MVALVAAGAKAAVGLELSTKAVEEAQVRVHLGPHIYLSKTLPCLSMFPLLFSCSTVKSECKLHESSVSCLLNILRTQAYLEQAKLGLNLPEEAARRATFIAGDFFNYEPEEGPFDWGYDYT